MFSIILFIAAFVLQNIKSHSVMEQCFDYNDSGSDGGLLPALHMERRKGLERSLAGEKLEATLCVLDPSHTKEPHKEVKPIHQKRAEHRSLWKWISLPL